jgi:phosphoribosylamine-glycine ligase
MQICRAQRLPNEPVRGEPILLSDTGADGAQLYHAAANLDPGGQLLLTGSRAVAYVGISDSIAKAEGRPAAISRTRTACRISRSLGALRWSASFRRATDRKTGAVIADLIGALQLKTH